MDRSDEIGGETMGGGSGTGALRSRVKEVERAGDGEGGGRRRKGGRRREAERKVDRDRRRCL